MDEVENFFRQFPNPWALGCQGWVVIPQNVKKVKITAPYSTPFPPAPGSNPRPKFQLAFFDRLKGRLQHFPLSISFYTFTAAAASCERLEPGAAYSLTMMVSPWFPLGQ